MSLIHLNPRQHPKPFEARARRDRHEFIIRTPRLRQALARRWRSERMRVPSRAALIERYDAARVRFDDARHRLEDARHAYEEARRRLEGPTARAREAMRSTHLPPMSVAMSRVPHVHVPQAMHGVRAPRSPWLLAAGGAAMGALVMYYADPAQGRRRRAMVRDKLAHFRRVVTREMPRKAAKRGRFVRGVASGVRHDAAGILRGNHHGLEPDNETLVARVRSAALRDGRIKAGEIHVDAYEGCVTLRGQLEDRELIDRLINAARHVDGVHEVRSYLHLPGTLPPNKAQSYAAGIPAHLSSN